MGLTVLVAVGTGLVRAPAAASRTAAYASRAIARPAALRADTLRRSSDSLAGKGDVAAIFRGSIGGLLSIAGLPPVAGRLEMRADGLVFVPAGGGVPLRYPLYRQGRESRIASVSLFEVDPAAEDSVYLFHLDGGVFETSIPGALRLLADHPELVDSLPDPLPRAPMELVPLGDTDAAGRLLDSLAASPLADSLYQLFGRPAHRFGLVGPSGQEAGRLGEYIASRDSISLAPTRMTSVAQLRHGFTHEMAHHWARKSPELRRIWHHIPGIADPLRYGYHNREEHQAEAVAFAVHFLQTSARPDLSQGARLTLLDDYERLVPGTRAVAQYLLSRPLYAAHPLAGSSLLPSLALTGSR